MPTYEYKCLKCRKKFDQLQKITADPLKKCIFCGGKVERLISAGTGLIFKGSGFYITDYKNKSSSSAGDKKPDSKKSTTEKSSSEKKKD